MSDFISFKSKSLLDNGVEVSYNLNIPVLGDSAEAQNNEMLMIEPILTHQYLSAIKDVLSSYRLSPLPERFIERQKFLIACLPTFFGLYGLFNLVGDNIIVDADTIIGAKRHQVLPDFLFGHEMGHKIAKYRATAEVYEEIARVLGISFYDNNYVVKETYADECGNMVSPIICEHGILPCPLDEHKREGIKRLILNNIYR